MKKYIVMAIMLLSFVISNVPTSAYSAEKSKKTTSVKKKKTKKKSGSGPDYAVMNFLPLGAGQFNQGRPMLGAVFAGGQVGMLGFYMYNKMNIDKSNDDATKTIADIKKANRAPTSAEKKYLDDNSAYVKSANSMASLALIGFVGVYAASVVDAVWDPLGLHKAAASKAKTVMDMEEGPAKWAAEKQIEAEQTSAKISMFALPPSQDSGSTFGLSLAKSFR